MNHFDDIFSVRETIMTKVTSDSLLCKALVNYDSSINLEDSASVEFPEDLQYEKVFPFKKSLDTLTEKTALVTLDINFTGKDGNYFKDMSIIFFVIVHEDLLRMRYNNRTVLRTDFLASRLDVLFNQNINDIFYFDLEQNKRIQIKRDIGIGKLGFAGLKTVDNLPQNFVGAALVYTTVTRT